MLPKDRARFWSHVTKSPNPAGCWLWTGDDRLNKYGLFRIGSRATTAHRIAYEEMVGPIPAGLVIDHLCCNPACVNPSHLEPVTRQINTLRGLGPRLASERMKARNRERTQCKHGHPYTPENTYHALDGRRCHRCRAHWMREWRKRKKNMMASRSTISSPGAKT
jgi:hypothetical protein